MLNISNSRSNKYIEKILLFSFFIFTKTQNKINVTIWSSVTYIWYMNTINTFSAIPFHVSRVKEEPLVPVVVEESDVKQVLEVMEKFEKLIDVVEEKTPIAEKVEEVKEVALEDTEEKSVENYPVDVKEIVEIELPVTEDKSVEVVEEVSQTVVEEKVVEEVVSTKKKKK